MSLLQDITNARNTAMKQRDAEKLSVLRILCAAVKNEEIEKGGDLSDEAVQNVIARQVKQLKDSMKDFAEAGREDLAAKAEFELGVLKQYLPEQLSDEELQKIVNDMHAEMGDGANLGALMGRVMGAVKGRADGNRVREMVQAALEG